MSRSNRTYSELVVPFSNRSSGPELPVTQASATCAPGTIRGRVVDENGGVRSIVGNGPHVSAEMGAGLGVT